MPFRRYVVPDFAYSCIRSNPVAHAHDSQKRFPKKAFHSPRAVRFHHLEFRIRKQRKIQFVLHFEFCLRLHGIPAASQDGGVGCFEFIDGVTKLGRFRRSTGRVRLGIEI